MPIDRRLALALAAVAVGATFPSASAAPTCDGKPVTQMGTDGPDTLEGTNGDDVIHGLGGNDRIETSLGTDVICGGPGGDRIILNGDQAVANLKKGVAVTTLGAARLLDIEHADGTDGDDVLIGDSARNSFFGGAGNDKISTFGGRDFIAGQDGNDLLDPGSGPDELRTSETAGRDTLSYRSAEGAISITQTASGGQVAEHRGETIRTEVVSRDDLIGNFPILEGSGFNDKLTAIGSDSNILRGLGGDDSLIGGPGNDSLNGAKGDDILNGGPGNDGLSGGGNSEVKNINARGDIVDYRKAGNIDGVIVDLAANTASGDGIGNDVLLGIESATATKKGPSFLFGNDGPNVLIGDHWYDELHGAGGDDILIGARETDLLDGGAGSDFLDGGDDSDSFIPREGDDVIVGGSGCKSTCPADDDLDYTSAPNAVNVDLSSGTASTGAWGTDTFVEIESVIGSSFNDVLIGDSGDNTLIGGAGSDSANGAGGFDYCEAEERVGCEAPARRQRI